MCDVRLNAQRSIVKVDREEMVPEDRSTAVISRAVQAVPLIATRHCNLD